MNREPIWLTREQITNAYEMVKQDVKIRYFVFEWHMNKYEMLIEDTKALAARIKELENENQMLKDQIAN
jgi:hypothetical protein